MDEIQRTDGRGITGGELKYLAALSMLIDHLAVGLLEQGIFLNNRIPDCLSSFLTMETSYRLYTGMRNFGRIAFPIYVFLLVEGFFHTRSRKKTLINLLLFGVISEIPFNLAFFGEAFVPYYQNVMFTLAWGYGGMMVTDYFSRDRKTAARVVLATGIFGGFAYLSHRMFTDYGYHGVIAIGIFYLLQGEERWRKPLSVLLGFYFEGGFAYLSAIPLYFYNGARGKQNKYFFYWFYPVHLAVIYGMRRFMMC